MAEIGNVTVRVDAVITDEQYREAMGAVRAANERMDLLEAENAKLRELVSDFDKCLTEAARLAYIQGHMTIYDGTLLDSLHPRMRELGIEVDE